MKNMKKMIAALLLVSLAVGFSGCWAQKYVNEAMDIMIASSNEKLIEELFIGDPIEKANERFGMPVFDECYSDFGEYWHYQYPSIYIYGLEFKPHVYTNDRDEITRYRYTYWAEVGSGETAEIYDMIVDDFVELYGPMNREEGWYFTDGTTLLVKEGHLTGYSIEISMSTY